MGERTTVIGTILAVVFQNEENGYTVARIVTDDGEPVTVVGCIPCAAPGEELILTGRYTTHPQHGEQFAADEVERHMPTGETEILNYLASGVVRGIGPATAQKLVDRFGADTLDVLDGEPEKLKTIKGITDKRAREIAESWRELAGLRRVLDFLTKYDLPVGLAMQLFRRYGADAMDALRRNPYLLSGEAFGVDFSVSDEIALSMGFSGDSSCRTEAGVLFELSHNEQSGGHVFLPREKLVAATAQLLDGDTDTVEKALDDLLERGSVVQEPGGERRGLLSAALSRGGDLCVYARARHACRQAGQAARREEDHRRDRARAGHRVCAIAAAGRGAGCAGGAADPDRRAGHGQDDERARHRSAL